VPMPRKSLEAHALAGTKPHYEVKASDSHIVGGRPKCPRYLTLDAKKKFRSLMRELEARRVLTPGDGSLLTLAATLWDRWRKAQQQVDEQGAVVTLTFHSKNGETYERDKKNPWLEVAQVTEKQLTAILVSLGLTVAHRDKAKPTTPPAEKNRAPEIANGADVLAFIQKRDG
jgi:P27 family predicted phage terminase small subunit